MYVYPSSLCLSGCMAAWLPAYVCIYVSSSLIVSANACLFMCLPVSACLFTNKCVCRYCLSIRACVSMQISIPLPGLFCLYVCISICVCLCLFAWEGGRDLVNKWTYLCYRVYCSSTSIWLQYSFYSTKLHRVTRFIKWRKCVQRVFVLVFILISSCFTHV